jgi:outer membrane protein assembly factor BamB
MLWLRTALAFFLITNVARADDWPQWLGPKRDGGTLETVKPWTEAPKAVWRMAVGKAYSCPAVADGKVFIHAPVNNKEAEEVIALDAKTGGVLWRDSYERMPYKGVLGTGPRATPTVMGNRVYACGITGVLSCYEADGGKRLWQVDTYKNLGKSLPTFGVCCSPLVIGNVVLLSVGGKGCSLVAYDADKGEMLWKAYDEPASTSSPVLMAAPGQPGKLPDVLFMTTLRLLAVNPLDGSLSWEFPLVYQSVGASTTPLVIGNRIVTSTMTNGATSIQVTPKDGKRTPEQLWQNKDMTGYFSTGTVVNKEHVYLVTNVLQPKPVCTLRCVELQSGKELWNKEGVGYYHSGIIRTGDNHLLMLDDGGTLRLLAADPKACRELCSAKVCGGTFAVPSLSNGRLYVRDDKELICLELAP